MTTRHMAYKLKSGGRTQYGGWNAVRETVNPNVLRYVSQHILRIMYLQELGVTWDQPIATKPRTLSNFEEPDYPVTVEYVISVTRLNTVRNNKIEKELDELSQLRVRNRRKSLFQLNRLEVRNFLKEFPDALQISRPAIEWGFKHFKSIALDDQNGNFLECPVTGKVLPYDVLNIDYMMRHNRLKLPLDNYWKAL